MRFDRFKRILSFALQSIGYRKSGSVLTVVGVGLATAMMVSALSVSHGYRQALSHDIEMMGYQVLITGKGCPHEAARALALRPPNPISKPVKTSATRLVRNIA